ncbi:MAG: 4-hydroxy-tetrahydrodipicolinate synthase [Saprospiraceae bacterium]|nr:4-hydroxy-tetrahydrodipicolinate synthase [Saprospiraceae bacterium]
MSKFRGLGVALVTPMKNGRVDFPALEKITAHVIEGGVDYLVALGTTGESVTLTSKECLAVFDCVKNINRGRLPVVAGYFGQNNTTALLDRIKEFDFEGFDGILSSSPSYNKPSQEGIYQHYMRVADASPLPVILYNVPGRTGSNVLPETTLRLAEAHNNIVAVKEASGDIVQGSQIIKHAPEGFDVLSGDDPTALGLMSCGGKGLISVIANALPVQTNSMIQESLIGNFDKARERHLELLDFHKPLYADGNPAGIKGLLNLLGLCQTEVRLPLVPLKKETQEQLTRALRNMKSAAKA